MIHDEMELLMGLGKEKGPRRENVFGRAYIGTDGVYITGHWTFMDG